MFDGELTEREEADKLIRRARIKAREIETKIAETGGSYDAIIYDAYNAMFMAARAALHALGHESNSHRTVESKYRHEIVEKKLIDAKYDGYLAKIKGYWEEEQAGTKHEIDAERAKRICEATREIVDQLAELIGGKKSRVELFNRELYAG